MLTGIFSGSFNPIHIGHLALANWICEFGGVDELWFLVSPCSPLKEEAELMDERLRFGLVARAIADYPKFRVSDFEFALPRPSFTINTMRALRVAYPDREFALIIGADSWTNMSLWKDSEALIAEFNIIIYPRKAYDIIIPPEYTNVKAVEAPVLEVSSTFIRHALKAGHDVRYFLPFANRAITIEH
ncbi:MAG: nicotinate-nucleotide adenylyltransferase [Tannerella sp.]|jgi:nicotinate-nucleotide adenylyltransferase|nr:nicotinate-nucleotide adenylyltransferase [Tannerella sp.]